MRITYKELITILTFLSGVNFKLMRLYIKRRKLICIYNYLKSITFDKKYQKNNQELLF